MKRQWIISISLFSLFALLAASCGTLTAPTATPEPTATPTSAPTQAPSPTKEARESEDSETVNVPFSTRAWETDFSKHSVPYEEIMSGGPPKDGIPPVDDPAFISVDDGNEWLEDQEPVIEVEIDDESKAYPLQIMTWHEIVNDELADVPITVTFCPLCNTAIAFKRQLDGVTYDFGTTGKLRFSDLVMYDRQTESWWQQITGTAIVGELTGKQLEMIPAPVISWSDYKAAHPEGQVLSQETGYARPYGQNPYVGYDKTDQSPFLFRGPTDGRLPPMERVATVEINGETKAYPFSVLEKERAVEDTIGGQDLVVFYTPGTVSALDARSITESKDVGSTGIFKRELEGQSLSFAFNGNNIKDLNTESTWNILGEAVEGELNGEELEPLVHGNHFWFAWAAFKPETKIYQGQEEADTSN